jgi:16S rRNA (guanine527-N7)-methyltransferase
MRDILSRGFDELNIAVSDTALEHFKEYYDFLALRNSVMNLTAISGEEQTAKLHFLDCAALLRQFDFSGRSVIDIGSGAGFPGIPLKLASPDISLTMLDSNQKKVGFMSEVCELLGLGDVSCIAARAEDAIANMRDSFDIAVSRAVARLQILCELCLPFVKVGGVFIAMKGPDCVEELREANHAITLLGGASPEIKTYIVPGTDIVHSAVIIKKTAKTPPWYPRQFGKIKKAPL